MCFLFFTNKLRFKWLPNLLIHKELAVACFEHGLGDMLLGKEHRKQHEKATDKLFCGVGLVKYRNTRHESDDGFERHDERAKLGRSVFLTERLQGESDACREDADIQDCHYVVADCGCRRKALHCHCRQAQQGRNHKLHEREFEGIGHVNVLVDEHDLQREHHGAKKQHTVRIREGYVRARHAHKVESEHADCDCHSAKRRNSMPYKQSQKGDDDDVQRSDKARLAHGGALDADLLKVVCQKQAQSAQRSADERLFVERLGLFATLFVYKMIDDYDHGNKAHRQRKTKSVESEKRHVGGRLLLKHKRESPDKRTHRNNERAH